VCAKLFSLPDLIEYTDYAFSKCDWDDVETGLRLLSTKRLCKPHKKHIAETITSLNMGDIYDAERKFLDLVEKLSEKLYNYNGENYEVDDDLPF